MRSIDQVLSEATEHSSFPWRYWRIFVTLGICNASDATEILSLSYILAHSTFEAQILHHSAIRSSVLATSVFVGMLVGGLSVVVWKPGRRKPALKWGLATNALAGAPACLAPNVWVLAMLRFVAGVGIGFSIPPMFTLCSELVSAQDRGFWVAFAASFWMVGSVFVAIVGWILLQALGTSWRVFCLVCAIPSALGFAMVHQWVPESPRYLALRGYHSEAVEVMEHITIHTLNYQGQPWTVDEAQHQYPESSFHDSQDASLTTRTFHVEQPLWFRAQLAWKDFGNTILILYTKGIGKTTWPLQAIWFTLSFGSYGLSTWINTLFVQVHLQNMYFNALLFALSTLPGNILSALLLDKLGRATILAGSLVAAALSLLAFAYIAARDSQTRGSGDTDLPKSLIVWSACAFQCFAVVAWNTIGVMTPELYPTSMRNVGVGLCGATGRIGAMLAQIVNGYTVQKPAQLLSIAAGALLFGAVSPLFLPPDKTRQSVDDGFEVLEYPDAVDVAERTAILSDNADALDRQAEK